MRNPALGSNSIRRRICRLAVAAVVTSIGGLLSANLARAEEKPKTALLLVEWWGPVTDAAKIDILGGFAAALGTQGYTVVEDRLRDDTLAGDKRLAKCIGTLPCKLEIGERTNADLVVDASVTFDPGPAPAAPEKNKKDRKSKSESTREVAKDASKDVWKVAVTLLPLDVHHAGAEGNRKCTGCTAAEVGPLVTSVIGETVASEKKKPRGTLVVHSKPTGAGVRLDGDELGVTDLRHAAYVGPHALDVWLGDKKVSTQVEVEVDGVSEWDADLEGGKIEKRLPVLVAPETLQKKPAPRWAKPAGIGLLAGGAALLGVGIAGLVLDGQGTCSLEGGATRCKQVWNSLPYGIGFTAVGGLAALGGAGLLTWAILRPEGEKHVMVAPTMGPDSVGLVAAGRF